MKGYKSLGQDLRSIKKYSGPISLGLAILLLLSGFYCGVRYLRLKKPPTESFPLTLKWQTDLGVSTYDRPYYQAGVVFMSAQGYWYGIEATTGQVIWSQTAFGYLRCLTPDYMVISDQAFLSNLEPDTGRIIWKGDTGYAASCSKTTMFAIGARGFLYAVDLPTGKNVFGGVIPPQTFGGVIYNPETDELIADAAVIVDPNSGHILRYFEPSFIGYAPSDGGRGPMDLVDNGQLFIGGSVRDAETGQVLHLEESLGGYAAPTVTEDTIYIADSVGDENPKGVTALDRNSFEIKWQYAPKDEPSGDLLTTMSPVTVFDGVGYVIFSDATLRAFDLETGHEIAYWQPKGGDLFYWNVCTLIPFMACKTPEGYGTATSKDTLFASFGDGKLYAFGK